MARRRRKTIDLTRSATCGGEPTHKGDGVGWETQLDLEFEERHSTSTGRAWV
uniref:Uncharacterized protein n=1 Tax=Cucumis melo TaxID=3656 RepID=A0A9I9D575_CUCME